jgi:hypothetical protein
MEFCPWRVIRNTQLGSTKIVLNLSMMMQGPEELWPGNRKNSYVEKVLKIYYNN